MADQRGTDDQRNAFEAALGGEYFALNGLRSGTTAEAGTRASMFFTTLTGTLLALGFLAGNTDAAVAVAYAAVPAIGLIGVLSFLRLVELAVLDVRALQAIQRIRDYWRALVPEGNEFFPSTAHGQAVDIVLDTGERRGRVRATLTIAMTVAVMDSLWIGAGVAFAVAHAGAPTIVALAVGAIVGGGLVGVMFQHQSRRFGAVVGDDSVPQSVT